MIGLPRSRRHRHPVGRLEEVRRRNEVPRGLPGLPAPSGVHAVIRRHQEIDVVRPHLNHVAVVPTSDAAQRTLAVRGWSGSHGSP